MDFKQPQRTWDTQPRLVGPGSGRKVFAHYLVGLTCDQPPERWVQDIAAAQQAGIDGFALNIGPSDPWTWTQLDHAYRAAERSEAFFLFISFDMAAGSWSVAHVVSLIRRYQGSSAQMKVHMESVSG
ncbi:hypothetical protein VTH82DRAFT_8551 [Thermothelomyces myriococcoides]